MSLSKPERLLQALFLVLFFRIQRSPVQHNPRKKCKRRRLGACFSVTSDSGRQISPSNFGGKVLLVNFWATWCAPCVQEIPSLNLLQTRFRDRGLVVLGISVDKDEAAYKQFVSRFRLSFLTTRDPEQKINNDYGSVQFPETYIINAQGKVVNKIIGEANWTDDKMVNYVQSLL